MYIADDKVEEVRSASDIVDVVGDYVRLKKRGSNYVGLCPFHAEKTPSFNVNPGMQIYKCFGCGVGGDVFQFIKSIEKFEFPEAVHLLAEKAGITIPVTEPEKSDDGPRESIYAALRFASEFFRKNLFQDRNMDALNYLVDKRGIKRETIDKFSIGYAPDSWDALIKAAGKAKISPEHLAEAGLVVTKDSGSQYDRYRDRVIFPIQSSIGKIIGFGGRILDSSKEQAKYINSPETKVYHKSEVLYGLFHSKRAIRASEEALLVEGYTDVISLHQAGIENVIASSGTSLTEQQVAAIKRYCKKVVILFDGDAAGVKAAVRGIELLLRAGIAPYVVTLPAGEDPDTFVQTSGPAEFRRVVESSRIDFIEFALMILKDEGVFDTPEGTAAGQRRIIKLISQVQDDLIREAYVQRATELLGLAEFRIHDELTRMSNTGRRRSSSSPGRQQAPSDPAPEKSVRRNGPLPEEKSLIRLMIHGGEPMIELILGNMALDEFSTGPARETVSFLLQMYEAGSINKKRLTDGSAGDSVRDLVTEVMVSENEPSRNWERMQNIIVPRLDENAKGSAVSAMRLLKLDRVGEAIEHVRDRIYTASQRGEDIRDLQEELQSLFDTRKNIEENGFLVEHE